MKNKKTMLFCLPFAGGSATLTYNKWKEKLSDNIIVKPIELAGRGNRILEDFYEGVSDAVDDIYNLIMEEVEDDYDYAIFGHSMGAFLAYEVTQKIQAKNKKMPTHIFVSGRHAPNIEKSRNYSKLDDETFKQKIFELGATPKAIFENPEFQRIFLPILRNDFKIAEAPKVRDEISQLGCGITVLIGDNEGITDAEALAWRLHTTRGCTVKFIEGDHFFILKNEQKVLNIVIEQLSRKLAAKAVA